MIQKKMKPLTPIRFLSVLLLLSLQSFAQLEESFYPTPKTTQTTIISGASFSFQKQKYNAFTQYITPIVKHSINPRLKLNVAADLQNSDYNFKYFSNEQKRTMGVNSQSNAIYGGLSYKISDNMVLGAMMYYGNTNITLKNNEKLLTNIDGKGFLMNLDYRISEKAFLNMSIDVSNGYNPSNNLIYGGYGFDNSFYHNFFNSFDFNRNSINSDFWMPQY